MFSDLVREHEPKMQLDGGKMPVFTFSESDASDNDKPPDQSEEHEATEKYKAVEPTQQISSVTDNEITQPSDAIKQVKEDIEKQ